eukprot:1074784-Rhodomonas_salina.1
MNLIGFPVTESRALITACCHSARRNTFPFPPSVNASIKHTPIIEAFRPGSMRTTHGTWCSSGGK